MATSPFHTKLSLCNNSGKARLSYMCGIAEFVTRPPAHLQSLRTLDYLQRGLFTRADLRPVLAAAAWFNDRTGDGVVWKTH